MPAITGILETSLYVADLSRSASFYEALFGFKRMFVDDRLCALSVAGKQVLLLFKRGASTQPIRISGGEMPPHDGSGPLHLALACTAEELSLGAGKALSWGNLHFEMSAYTLRCYRKVVFLALVV